MVSSSIFFSLRKGGYDMNMIGKEKEPSTVVDMIEGVDVGVIDFKTKVLALSHDCIAVLANSVDLRKLAEDRAAIDAALAALGEQIAAIRAVLKQKQE